MTNYNLTNYTSADTVVELAVAANELTSGVLFILLVGLIWVIAFTALVGRYEMADAALSASLLTLVAGSMLFFAGLLSETALLVLFVVFLMSLILRALR